MNAALEMIAIERDKKLIEASNLALAEARLAGMRWPEFSSVHEGYAVLFEEVDELWDEVRAKRQDVGKLRREAIQVAAMALRFVAELT